MDRIALLEQLCARFSVRRSKRPDELEAALAAYEDDLFTRSEDIARRSAENLQRFFDADAPSSVVELFKGEAGGR